MKKSFRVLTMALAIALLVSVMPVAAFAQTWNFGIGSHFFHDPDGKRNFENWDGYFYGDDYIEIGEKDVTISTDSFDPIVKYGDELYELLGLDFDDVGMFDETKGVKDGLSNSLTFKGGLTLEEYLNKVGFPAGVYAIHKHKVNPNSPIYFDDNLDWQYCEICGGMVAHHHHDVDEDGTCDFCKQPIVYHNVTVKQAEGGKVEVSKDKCMLTNRVAITVTPDEGYELSDIRGINNNKQHSVRPCIVDKKGSQYHLIVDVWDVEIQPTFVKSK